MRIVILNGNPKPENGRFDWQLAELTRRLLTEGHEVAHFTLRDLKIRQCVGCFHCWIKTPGLCIFKDDQEAILKAWVPAELVIAASPLIMGFTSALLKRSCDRMVPVALPYIDRSSGECRHYLRYGHAPQFGVVYTPEPDTDPEDLAIVADLWQRLARNAGGRLAFFKSLADPAAEVTP